jgi:hypothetical protein
MSLKNDGRLAQREFEAYWEQQGKAAYLFRLTDAAEVAGMNAGRFSTVKKQPADYLLLDRGRLGFAEVKSTENPKGFRLSMLTEYQLGTMQRVTAAGGGYDVFVRRLGPAAAWYRVPAVAVLAAETRSLSWEQLEAMRVDMTPVATPTKKAKRPSFFPAQGT